jgi:hypothetical protein
LSDAAAASESICHSWFTAVAFDFPIVLIKGVSVGLMFNCVIVIFLIITSAYYYAVQTISSFSGSALLEVLLLSSTSSRCTFYIPFKLYSLAQDYPIRTFPEFTDFFHYGFLRP